MSEDNSVAEDPAEKVPSREELEFIGYSRQHVGCVRAMYCYVGNMDFQPWYIDYFPRRHD